MKIDLNDKKILVTGGAGFLGYHVVQELLRVGVPRENIFVPRSSECDLREYDACNKAATDKDIVIHLAAKVGGISYNKAYPATIFDHNALMNMHMIRAAHKAGVKKFIMIGSVCEYPKITPVPFKEDDLWNGYPEESNGAYGLSKKLALVQGQAYRQEFGFPYIHLLMTNLYGPRDNFNPNSSHVIPALIKKFYDKAQNSEDKTPIVVWGTGKATREFVFVEDAARAIVLATQHYDEDKPVNIGSGMEISIRDLVQTIAQHTGYSGDIVWDTTKPDGQPRRSIDTSRALEKFQYKATIDFNTGIKKTIDWYRDNPFSP